MASSWATDRLRAFARAAKAFNEAMILEEGPRGSILQSCAAILGGVCTLEPAASPTPVELEPLVLRAALEAHGRRLGFLEVRRPAGSAPFDANDRLIAESLADQAALALHNARLLREARERQLPARLAHDLKTPLTAIMGFTELVYLGQAGPVSPDQAECLGDALTGARQLLQVIEEMAEPPSLEREP